MVTYVVTGVSRGIGYAFLDLLSDNPQDIVVGLVRNKTSTDKKILDDAKLKSRTNIHIVQADLTNYESLKQATAETEKIVGGKVDYLIANAALVTLFDAYDPIGSFADRPQELESNLNALWQTNVVGNIHLYNLFLPLVLKGQAKKIVTVSSGLADVELTNKFDVVSASLYSTTKAAVNMVVAKYSAQYKEKGVLFLALSPGMVDVGHYKDMTPEQLGGLQNMLKRFTEYAPDFKGPITPEESVRAMKTVIEKASVENGDGGKMLSHKGDTNWL